MSNPRPATYLLNLVQKMAFARWCRFSEGVAEFGDIDEAHSIENICIKSAAEWRNQWQYCCVGVNDTISTDTSSIQCLAPSQNWLLVGWQGQKSSNTRHSVPTETPIRLARYPNSSKLLQLYANRLKLIRRAGVRRSSHLSGTSLLSKPDASDNFSNVTSQAPYFVWEAK